MILVLNFIALIAAGLSYLFLSAYTGLATIFVAIIRNLIFLCDDKLSNKNNKIQKNDRSDILILLILYTMCFIIAFYMCTDFWSLMPVFSTVLYTYSVWQKKTHIYKILGIPIGLILLAYNIYLFSFFGIIFQSMLTLSAIIGFIREKLELKSKLCSKELNLCKTN